MDATPSCIFRQLNKRLVDAESSPMPLSLSFFPMGDMATLTSGISAPMWGREKRREAFSKWEENWKAIRKESSPKKRPGLPHCFSSAKRRRRPPKSLYFSLSPSPSLPGHFSQCPLALSVATAFSRTRLRICCGDIFFLLFPKIFFPPDSTFFHVQVTARVFCERVTLVRRAKRRGGELAYWEKNSVERDNKKYRQAAKMIDQKTKVFVQLFIILTVANDVW